MAAKQKILIVDDDVNIAELISLYLTKECFDTKMVHDGESALKEFEIYAPNLILLDLMLPGIDGYQVCREIRAKAKCRRRSSPLSSPSILMEHKPYWVHRRI
jgi:DNA-binding response OmpR family regulator